ncbi:MULTISPECIES: M3 family metallopeptidase [Cysteiniphilum]|uniref:oligopeptidase A n=1 Tax=Cysteiniphilum litorale TaxID=2056700 RepID=A0A8J2Z2A6_9GAMM|nr:MULTISPECIES: M3 family metallopeptidase [Cysteiniphilum]GGF89957.1 oligopeptidase A [Cysteiniphilum litorale]
MSDVVTLDLPKFSQIDINNAKTEVEERIKYCRDLKEQLLKESNYTWDRFIYPLEEAEDALSKTFGPLGHLNAVKNTPQLREVYQYCVEKISEYSTQTAQDERMLKAYQIILQHDKTLDQAQIKAINDAIRSFKLSGVDLEGDKREKFEQVVTKLAKLQSDFENNVLDATMAWHYHTLNEDELKGLSDSAKEQARLKAKTEEKDGFVLGLDAPTYISVMQQADNRKLRETFYKAYVTRASSEADNKSFDNTKVMQEIMRLRAEEARLLGFKNYAEVSLATKMATSVDEVMHFMQDLLQKAKPHAQKELKELQEFAKQSGLDEELKPWDSVYYSDKMKKARYDFTSEELRPYFPLNHVIKGLFSVLSSLYGITAKKRDDWDRYHPQTELYEFYDENKQLRGAILVDFFARAHKRDGAWMDECRTRYKRLDHSVQTPVAYVTCNFMPANEGADALLTHNDVLTLFHEFGHALQHILTQVEYLPVSGINGVEWDAVELPSQFMENFCWCEEGLQLLSQHVETKQSLPKELFQKLVASRQYQSGLAMLRQLEFALFDMQLHQSSVEDLDIHQIIEDVRQSTALLEVPKFNRFENGFSHIFAGGYAAGYYSYKWAEVLSSDAFAEFEQGQTVLNKAIGQKFMHIILEKGGSAPAAELFEKFKGQKPSVDALLRHNGIV